MNLDNTIYLDTITNKNTLLKKQTKFLLAPYLLKLKEKNIKYIVLFPSIMEKYTKQYGSYDGLKIIYDDFITSGGNKEKFITQLVEQRKQLGTKVYEPLGFKSYDLCPGFLEDNWRLDPSMMVVPPDTTYHNAEEIVTMINKDTNDITQLLIPTQYWMIAKVDEIHKKLLIECLKGHMEKIKQIILIDH